MSAIVKIDAITVSNLDLAIKVATKNGFNHKVNGNVSGVGRDSRVDHLFSLKNGKNFGLLKNANSNSFEILCDTDWKQQINEKFVANYMKEYTEYEAQLSGNECNTLLENDDEIHIAINYN